jgi:hypothetical protein
MNMQSELVMKAATFRDQAVEEYGTNRRVRLMVWLAIYVAIVWLIVGLIETGDDRSKKARQLALEQRAISTYESIEDWSQRLVHEQDANKSLRELCWQGDTPGVASADIQTFLQQRLNEHDIKNMRLKLSEPVELPSMGARLWSIKAEIIGKTEKFNFPPLIASLEFGDKGFQISRLQHLDKRSGLINLLMTTCISTESSK